VQPSQVCRRRKKPKKLPGACYTTRSYAQAIAKACRRAGVPHWHPNQIRHTVGTDVREQHGLDGAQVFLGHSHANVTQIYAEKNAKLADAIALAMG
jgi:integrase